MIKHWVEQREKGVRRKGKAEMKMKVKRQISVMPNRVQLSEKQRREIMYESISSRVQNIEQRPDEITPSNI